MPINRSNWVVSTAAAALALISAAPSAAGVKDGVDAWSRGDYAAAIAEWQGPAAQGDPDALFNLAQAYRLGRGVAPDLDRASELYRVAAAKGHLKAADNYGMLLFQRGERDAAMPYIRAASDRGDPRAQYVLGLAHFNADHADKDWERAYALMTLSHAAGLPQAASALSQMDGFIPMDQRQRAQDLAARIKAETDARRSTELAALDLSHAGPPKADATPRIPRRVETAPVAPSVASGPAYSPAQAGADFAKPPLAAQPVTRPIPQRAAATPPAPTPAASGAGKWAVQLGAFGVAGNADRLWGKLSGRSELSGAQKVLKPAGKVTILMAGGFDSRDAATKACSTLKSSGQDCLVKSL